MGRWHIFFCPVRLSVTFLSAAVTNETVEGLSWNCSIILSTSKLKAELFFPGRPIQDGRLTAILGQNLFWAIIAITNERLEGLSWNCSIILSTYKWKAEFQGHPIQDGRLTTMYGRNLLWAITRYWIEIFTSYFMCWYLKTKFYDFLLRSSNSRWLTDRHI